VAGRVQRGLIVACDTVAECGGRILGKPRDKDDARRMLRTLRGQKHRVFSGLCLWEQPGGRADVRVDVTILRMDHLSDAQIDDYLAAGAWQSKAGAFGYQDRLGWVHVTRGSESNVVGLPLELLAQMLAEFQG
jgi:septum formation protein